MSDGARAALAAALGVLPEYHDVAGRLHRLGDATRDRLLAALDAPTDEEGAREALDALQAEQAGRALAPSCVAVSPGPGTPLTVQARAAADAEVEYALWWRGEGEGDERLVAEGRGRADGAGVLHVVPPELVPPLGYHDLRLALRDPSGTRESAQRLIVVPPRCAAPEQVLGGERVSGLIANLYAVRSARNWGVGDLTDLRALARLARDVGAAFVGVNPLHALRNADGDVSPYSPVSRVFRNVLYLDVEAVPELAESDEARALLASPGLQERLAELRGATHVDYAGVMALKRPVLEALHRAFASRPAGDARAAAYVAWAAAQGEPLERFATFQALDEHFRPLGCGWWPEWPEEVRDPRGPGIAAFRAANAEAVDFHRWCQFELDRQLGAAAAEARALGLPVGLYEDLAIGASPAGSDVWAEPDLFLRDVSVGAPPDPLGPEGQNWGLPAVDPRRLRARGYDFWAALVRNALRHAGALRIDHVLGLFRQFWIPAGMSGAEGAYVRFPSHDLLGVLALESVRANALVVGEDLGTVPADVPPALARWGVLSSKVLVFEREGDGAFRVPRAYPRMALATANTHDLAPLAGWWGGRDPELRREVGLLLTDEAAAGAADDRGRERAAL
ncbi:4-alpha-glucanotransferase, partial [Roseisolibacter sp. H3M3-2]|uniref:4-alpha-glucanotransferase n=1 Tax=Roseisolibacter sp. H3M3-2 TaxID=3031323 RepID=UPI0023DC87EF